MRRLCRSGAHPRAVRWTTRARTGGGPSVPGMPDRTPPPAPARRDPAPPVPRQRRHPVAALATAALVLTVAALAGCDDARDPAPDAAAATALAATIAGLDGVAEATATDLALPGGSGDRGKAVAVQVDVRTAAEDADGFVAVAAAVAAELPATARVAARVWQRDVPGVPDLAAELSGAGDRGAGTLGILGGVADAAGPTGLTDLQVSGGTVSASAADARALGRLAGAVRSTRAAVAALATDDGRVSTYLEASLLDARLSGLVARVDGWPGVTSQLVGTEGTADVWLRVQVEGDDTVAALTAALTSAAWPADGPVVHAVVSSSFRSEAGVVGRPDPADPAAPPDPAGAATSPWPDDPHAPACGGADLDVSLGGFDAALGRRYLLLTATNTSDASCAVQSRPAIAFVRASGTPAPDVETGTPSGTPEPGRYVLPPGERLHAGLTWRGMSTALDPDVTVALRVTAAPGADPVDVPAGEHTLDVLAGAAVEIGAWEPAPEGWALDGGDG